jgi:hypothetical protein
MGKQAIGKIATRQLRHRILTDGIDIPRFGENFANQFRYCLGPYVS